VGVRENRLADWREALRRADALHCKLCGRRRRYPEDMDLGGYCGYCAPWDYGRTGGAGTEERSKKMADVWRVTVGDKVQESESFTPLTNIIQKLVNRRVPFKVGFGKSVEATVPGAEEARLTEEGAIVPDDDF